MDIKNNKPILFLCSFTFLSIGFINGLTNSKETDDKKYLSLYGSLPNIGIMVGLIFQKYFRFNSKYLIVLSCFVHAVSFYLEIFVPSFFILFLRFLLGLSYSFFMVCSTVYIEKISLKNEVNFFNSFSGSCGSIGLMISEGLNAFFQKNRQFSLYFFSLFFCFLFSFSLFIPKIKEQKSNFNCSELLNLFYFCILLLIQQFTFVNCILTFSKKIFNSEIKNLPFYLSVLNLVSNLFCVFLIFFINTPYFIYFTSLILSSVSLALISIKPFKNIFLFFLIFFYSAGLGPLTWTVISRFMHFDSKKSVYLLGNVINSFISFLFVYFYGNIIGKKEEDYLYVCGSMCACILGIIFFMIKKRNYRKL